MVLPKRRGVLIRISCAMQSQLFFASSCACIFANVPGFSILKKDRDVARMKSCQAECQHARATGRQAQARTAWKRLWWNERLQPMVSSLARKLLHRSM